MAPQIKIVPVSNILYFQILHMNMQKFDHLYFYFTTFFQSNEEFLFQL